jgi:hypothetical protein
VKKLIIEMSVPDSCDPSEILERAQGLAVEIHEENQEDTDQDLDEDSITDAVSVWEAAEDSEIREVPPVPAESAKVLAGLLTQDDQLLRRSRNLDPG